MAKYLIQVSYDAAGVKGVIEKGGSKRKAAVEQAVAGMGGRRSREIVTPVWKQAPTRPRRCEPTW